MKWRGLMPSAQRPRSRVAIVSGSATPAASRPHPRLPIPSTRLLHCRRTLLWARSRRSAGAGAAVRGAARRRARTPCARRGDVERPVEGGDGRAGSRPPVNHPRSARRASGRVGGGDGPGVGRVDAAGEAVEQVVVVAEHGGRAREQGGDVALGDVVEQRQHLVADAVAQEPAVARCSGRRRGRGRGRRTAPRVSARRSASSGLVGPGRIAASPPAPAPRSRLMSTVSAWSSAVWPVRRRRAGPPRGRRGPAPRGWGPASTSTVRRSNGTPIAGGDPLGLIGLVARRRAQAVVDVDRRDLAAGGRGEDEQRGRVGAAGEGARRRRCRREGTCSAARRSSTQPAGRAGINPAAGACGSGTSSP